MENCLEHKNEANGAGYPCLHCKIVTLEKDIARRDEKMKRRGRKYKSLQDENERLREYLGMIVENSEDQGSVDCANEALKD